MYNYKAEKHKIFTENGQETFLKIRDLTHKLLKESGAVMVQNAIRTATGDTWMHLACIDRMVELGEIREIKQERAAGQHRIFVSANL